MKILLTSDAYYPVVNGVVRSLLNLKKYLEENGHEVRVLTLSDSIRTYIDNEVRYIGSLPAEKVYPEARISPLLGKKEISNLVEWKPHLIHSQCEFSTFLMAKKIAKKTQVPIVHTYHTVYEDYTHYFSPSRRVGKKIISAFSRTIAGKVDKVIAPSIKTKEILLSYGINEEKIIIIPTGIEIPKLMDRNLLREKYGYGKNDKIILYLGRIGEEKNIEELVEFYYKLNMKDLRFLLVGNGPYIEKLKQYDKTLGGKLEFVGMVDPKEVKDYYQISDLFVSASTSETQGLTYYEALSNGRIALCRKDSCLQGVIKNGFNGYQYENYEQFEKMLKEVFSNKNLKDTMEKNAREFALDNFSIESFGKKCELLYESLLGVRL